MSARLIRILKEHAEDRRGLTKFILSSGEEIVGRIVGIPNAGDDCILVSEWDGGDIWIVILQITSIQDWIIE